MTETVPQAPVLPTERVAGCPFDPPAALAELRAEQPVSRMTYPDGHVGYLATSHAAAKAVLTDRRFGSRGDLLRAPIPMGMGSPSAEVPPGMFTAMDPPEHTHYRRSIAGWFTLRRLRQLEPRITEIVDQHLDAIAAVPPSDGPVDLVRDFADPVSALVISELLGVAPEDQQRFLDATKAVFTVHSSAEEAMAGFAGLRGFLAELVQAKRDSGGDDLISTIAAEGKLTDEELMTIGSVLLMAGHDTSSNQLALSVYALLREPEQREKLLADPSLIGPATEELLRYLNIVHIGSIRAALEDFEFYGHQLKTGDAMLVSLSAANRDPEVYDHADELDLTRTGPGHLAFGHGVHQCVGQQLARIEFKIALTALFTRFPGLRLAVPEDEVRMRGDSIIYGVHELPVTWEDRTR
ncbi:cytochrome P450 [Amycolatopsis magusensis]|uniref:cytochrome P450 n=1 Tax=Amycolatopsis magusensis TaxID=882444 RepID=UPI0024A7CB37|nr:cytochrome P450 [Amycolatopsis magusensis]MDI5982618.1 cytochrome P450 [Amycolatopsis magusensis]